jgi:hypothetical protein
MLCSLFVAMPVFIKKIREKEDLQYSKHNKKLNDDYYPHLSSPV